MELELITFAETFYQSKGYQKVDVPWAVDVDVMDITRPEGRKVFDLMSKKLVASAEQSYLQLIKEHALAPGKYVTTTPCFRDDQEDELHQHYFLKTELINFKFEKKPDQQELESMIDDASQFFCFFLPVKRKQTELGYDIVDEKYGIELGSYGFRNHTFSDKHQVHWIYGTGIALPRLTYVIGKTKKKGYHEAIIPKVPAGSFLKILEETEEAKDAYLTKNPIMLLVELADLYGATELFLEKEFPGMDMKHLQKMHQVTKRAFQHGRR